MNKLYFFTNQWYALPGSNYEYGALAAPTEADAKLLLKTHTVDLIELADTTATGIITVGTEYREIVPAHKLEQQSVAAKVLRAKTDVDLKPLSSMIIDTIVEITGYDAEALLVYVDSVLEIPAEAHSSGDTAYRFMIGHTGYDNPQPIFIHLQPEMLALLEDTGTKEDYTFSIQVPLPLSPEALIVDLVTNVGQIGAPHTHTTDHLPDTYRLFCGAVREHVYSPTPVEGWISVLENHSGYQKRWWMDPNWETGIRSLYEAHKTKWEDDPDVEGCDGSSIDDDLDIPGLEPDLVVDSGADPSKDEADCPGCKI